MQQTTGWYYLHVNGDLIFKPDTEGVAADIRESDFAKGLWAIDANDRECAWILLVEALAGGANVQRVKELAHKWGCSNADGEIFASRVNCLLSIDGSKWMANREDFVNLHESPAGFGDTALEAMADLCKTLGYVPQKMWGKSFSQLLRE